MKRWQQIDVPLVQLGIVVVISALVGLVVVEATTSQVKERIEIVPIKDDVNMTVSILKIDGKEYIMVYKWGEGSIAITPK
jgi:hypothetical protein